MNSSRLQIARIIADKTISSSTKNLVNEVAAFLLDERLSHELDAIMRDIEQIRFDKGYIEATLETAHEVEQSVLADAKAMLKQLFPNAKSYTLHTSLNPALLGGLRLLLPGQILDLSLRRKVTKLKQLTAA